jgi:glucose/arabinose dehydrogenase
MKGTRFAFTLFAALVAGIIGFPGTVAAGSTPLTTELVVSGLDQPHLVTYAPGDFDRLFILEKRGRIRIVKDGVLLSTPFLDIDALVGGGIFSFDERGLLGLAFHPDYQNNGFFFVNYTDNSSNTVIARYRVSNDPDIADPGSAMIGMTILQPFENHNGGWIEFGPDGYLYIATGDGGSGNDPGNRAQDITDQLLGKILRIDIDGDDFPGDPDRNYAIPSDNPFVGVAGDDEIWAYGLRNPWRNDFDRLTGDLYIADVGQNDWEEIDFQPASSTGGENYGWRCMEGAHCTGLSGCDCFDPELVLPIHEYDHGDGCSITGGLVYRGCEIPDLDGTYFFGDYCSARIWSFRYDGVSITDFVERTAELDPVGGPAITDITSFGEDAFGELYICSQDGNIFKIVPADPPAEDCNENGRSDFCDLLDPNSDTNDNGILDDCEIELSELDPGIAGEINSITVSLGTPGETVFFVYGFTTGSTNIPRCDGFSVDIEDPVLLTGVVVDENGEATLSSFVPGGLSGGTVHLQAVEHATCTVSNLVTHTFP